MHYFDFFIQVGAELGQSQISAVSSSGIIIEEPPQVLSQGSAPPLQSHVTNITPPEPPPRKNGQNLNHLDIKRAADLDVGALASASSPLDEIDLSKHAESFNRSSYAPQRPNFRSRKGGLRTGCHDDRERWRCDDGLREELVVRYTLVGFVPGIPLKLRP